LLRPRGERPRSRRATDKTDELASLHVAPRPNAVSCLNPIFESHRGPKQAYFGDVR